MLMSIFSAFDALSAETFGQKVGFSWAAKEGKVDDSTVDRKGVSSPESQMKKDSKVVGNSTTQQMTKRRPRFAPELDGVHCFETIVPY
ncbi:hypothetical protein LOK49_LG01G01800 [Camellia lanceoleosa]|uniref:Uncharacterized protein n=1 Tax=Camellia lanceoleosa TaxID=1840588 RepID=A0ACC0J2C2_9ERIC|nr:hypothetical protein LOK49_LG01G01800 [Camellia lanceoleosa]